MPRSLCVGDYIAYLPEYLQTDEGQHKRISFAGGPHFSRMKAPGFYSTDVPTIKRRVADAGLTDVFAQKIRRSLEVGRMASSTGRPKRLLLTKVDAG